VETLLNWAPSRGEAVKSEEKKHQDGGIEDYSIEDKFLFFTLRPTVFLIWLPFNLSGQ
jgi:hypothetical protein